MNKRGEFTKSASQHFANFFNSYTKSINKAYQRTGSLFEKRFGRILIESHEQLQWLVVYIHRNPQNQISYRIPERPEL
jgi:putative transposase